MTRPTLFTPEFLAPMRTGDAAVALTEIRQRHQAAVQHLRGALAAYLDGSLPPGQRVRACYPYVRFRNGSTARTAQANRHLAFGFVSGIGVFETSVTRPDLFGDYYLEQLSLLLQNHGGELEVGTGTRPMPLHFTFSDLDHFDLDAADMPQAPLRDVFDLPDLTVMDDGIANGTFEPEAGAPLPLALFTAPRVDYSLQRLRHYSGTSPEHFQNFVLFTNYQFYIDAFIDLGRREMARADSAYAAFVEPGNLVTRRVGLSPQPADALGAALPRMPQMPAYHLVRPDRAGITIVNIGVGPSNAKTITDHIAVLRPHAWLMLGHCAGLRNSQQLGDYVLAHAYVRDDHVLDDDLPPWVPIPALAEVQMALQDAVADVTRLKPGELKKVMRTGTVASTDNRNWELLADNIPQRRLSQSRAIGLDMESAAIAANGFRFRVPYGTLLCVSDKPLHGELKLPGMANRFYRERVDQHFRIGIRALERLREAGPEHLHSRKLRSFAEVAFQ